MKRFFYSAYTKSVASVLFILFIVLSVFNAVQCISTCYTNENYVYNFRNDYRVGISHFMDYVSVAVVDSYHRVYGDNSNHISDEPVSFYAVSKDNDVLWKEESEKLNELLVSAIQSNLDSTEVLDNLDYFIKVNNTIFTNCGADSESDINKNSEMYLITQRDSHGNVNMDTNIPLAAYRYLSNIEKYGVTDTITICAAVKESFLNDYKKLWYEQEDYIYKVFMTVIGFLAGALVMLIYLTVVCSKNKDGELIPSFLDRMWTEITLLIPVAVACSAFMIAVAVLENYLRDNFPTKYLLPVSLSVSAATSFIVIVFFLSVMRKIKCGIFFKTSIIFILLSLIFKFSVRTAKFMYKKLVYIKSVIAKAFFTKTSLILFALFLIYTMAAGIFGILFFESPVFFLLAILLFAFASFFVINRGNDTDIIRKGTKEIRNGNISFKISEPKSEDMKEIAANINYIAEGLEKSVAERMKAERLKTELITNVSHDLKTPLTSVISYTELLLGVDGLPQEAKDYALIIAKKGEALKKLTQDLFDVAKVQSGNETFTLEKLDAALLVEQAIGEHDSEIRNSDITMCVKADKDLYIWADGKKMSRVLGNLIDNALRYSMKNTRVFITVFREQNDVVMEIKNISACPMEFDEEEILGRFVRGDESRTDGGNGLGLAIAQSFTQACGGQFKVVIDGDLFKAIIRFAMQ